MPTQHLSCIQRPELIRTMHGSIQNECNCFSCGISKFQQDVTLKGTINLGVPMQEKKTALSILAKYYQPMPKILDYTPFPPPKKFKYTSF